MALRILHVHTEHRGGGGTEIYIDHWADIFAPYGLVSGRFSRKSQELPAGIAGQIQAGLNVIHSPDSYRDFVRRVEEFQPDIVHVYDLFPLISPWILKYCHERGIPVVVYLIHYRLTCPVATHWRHGAVCDKCAGGREYWAIRHNCRGNLAESAAVALYNQFESRLGLFSRYVTQFIAPCEFVRQWLLDRSSIPPERILTVEHPVPIPEDLADPAAGGYVSFSGRFAPEKGLETYLQAARLCPEIPFRLTRNIKYSPKQEIPGHVEVVVTANRAELDRFYRGARVGVMPSTWFETFGITGAEMMALGLPVVVSRLGALTNLVDDGVDGLYAEPGNAEDLAAKIRLLWSDPERCREMGLAGNRKAKARWTWQRHVEGTLEAYDRALAAVGKPTSGLPRTPAGS